MKTENKNPVLTEFIKFGLALGLAMGAYYLQKISASNDKAKSDASVTADPFVTRQTRLTLK